MNTTNSKYFMRTSRNLVVAQYRQALVNGEKFPQKQKTMTFAWGQSGTRTHGMCIRNPFYLGK